MKCLFAADMISCVELDDGVEIKMTKSGKYLTSFHIPEYAVVLYLNAFLTNGLTDFSTLILLAAKEQSAKK